MIKDGTSVQLTGGEQQAIMNNPHGLRLLMDYADLKYCEAESMLEPGELGGWPTPRWVFLRDKGRSIIAEDPELWDDDTKRAFGLDVHNAKSEGAAAVLSRTLPHD